MRIRIAVVVCALLAAGSLGLALLAQEPADVATEQEESVAASAAEKPKVVLKEIEAVHPPDGPRLYTAYCADCHGESGRGDGPIAEALTEATGVEIPDLTRMTGESGEFDRGEARRAIARRHMVPVEKAENWHEVLVGSFGSHEGETILTRLAIHLESLQAPAEN